MQQQTRVSWGLTQRCLAQITAPKGRHADCTCLFQEMCSTWWEVRAKGVQISARQSGKDWPEKGPRMTEDSRKALKIRQAPKRLNEAETFPLPFGPLPVNLLKCLNSQASPDQSHLSTRPSMSWSSHHIPCLDVAAAFSPLLPHVMLSTLSLRQQSETQLILLVPTSNLQGLPKVFRVSPDFFTWCSGPFPSGPGLRPASSLVSLPSLPGAQARIDFFLAF